MILGAWFHTSGLNKVEDYGFKKAREAGFISARTYDYEHSKKIAKELRRHNMSLYAGFHVDAASLLRDWTSQLKQDHILTTCQMGVPLVALCFGNELREYEAGELPNWKFTGRLAFALSRLIESTKAFVLDHGIDVPLTYAMESFGLGSDGKMLEWVVPIVETVDVFSTNCYPMDAKDWFTLKAFDHNERFLRDRREANSRLLRFEYRLRCLLDELERYDKSLILSEIGLHAGIGFRVAKSICSESMIIKVRSGEEIIPVQYPEGFERVYLELMSVINKVSKDYPNRIRGIYLYEWRDNPFHSKIQSEDSPVHACFGLCYVDGTPKFNLSKLKETLET